MIIILRKINKGVALERKKFDYEHVIIDLNVYDTAGQERFHSITKSYYQNSDGVIFVFAINSLDSFNNIKNWMHDVKKHMKPNYLKLLVGAKADLEEERQVTKEEIHNFAKENDFDYLEASAKTKTNISDIFIYFAKQFHTHFSKEVLEEKNPIKTGMILKKKEDIGNSDRSCC